MCNTLTCLTCPHNLQDEPRLKNSRSRSPPSLADEQQYNKTASLAHRGEDLSEDLSLCASTDQKSLIPAMANDTDISRVGAIEGKDHVIVSMLQLVEMLEDWTDHRSYPPFPVLQVQFLEDHDEVILSAFAKALENYTRQCPSRIQFLGFTLHPKVTLAQAKILSVAIRRCHKLRAVRLDFAGARHRFALLLAAAAIGNPSVRSLLLDGNGLTDTSVRWLGGILERKYPSSSSGQHNCALKHLSLRHNPISPSALSSSIWKQIKVNVPRCRAPRVKADDAMEEV